MGSHVLHCVRRIVLTSSGQLRLFSSIVIQRPKVRHRDRRGLAVGDSGSAFGVLAEKHAGVWKRVFLELPETF